eukprot:jgi/Galph1/227/GphlegSOOS_G4961.1
MKVDPSSRKKDPKKREESEANKKSKNLNQKKDSDINSVHDGGGGGGDSTNGSSNFASDDNPSPKLEFAAACSLAKELNISVQDLPSHLWTLQTEQVSAYLASTSGGLVRFLANKWPAWQEKVLADPNFPFKLLMEETLGLGLGFSGMIAARGKDILKELDFATCDLAVGAAMNFILVWLLTPSISIQTPPTRSPLQQWLTNLPAHCFAASSTSVPFALQQRIAAFLYKGALFASCGFIGSMIGTSLAYFLLFMRRKLLKDTSTPRQLPNLFINSLAWAGFMFVSSNPRYQLLSGTERLLFHIAPLNVAKVSAGILRTVNNIAGGASWVIYARAIGLQKST